MFGFRKNTDHENTDHETVEPTYDEKAMQYHPSANPFRKYGFHEHLPTQQERDELEAKSKKMVLVMWGGTESVMTYGDYVRLEQELTDDAIKRHGGIPKLSIRDATEEEVKLHNEWLANNKKEN